MKDLIRVLTMLFMVILAIFYPPTMLLYICVCCILQVLLVWHYVRQKDVEEVK